MIGAHLLGIPLLLAYLALEYRAWRCRTAAPEVVAESKDYVLRWDADGIERGGSMATTGAARKQVARWRWWRMRLK